MPSPKTDKLKAAKELRELFGDREGLLQVLLEILETLEEIAENTKGP
jgi:hypothetical protein